MPNRSLRIDLSGDIAPAAYFMMAEWRNPATSPRLDTGDLPLKLLIDPSPEALAELRQAIHRIAATKPPVAKSATALLHEVERQAASHPQTVLF